MSLVIAFMHLCATYHWSVPCDSSSLALCSQGWAAGACAGYGPGPGRGQPYVVLEFFQNYEQTKPEVTALDQIIEAVITAMSAVRSQISAKTEELIDKI